MKQYSSVFLKSLATRGKDDFTRVTLVVPDKASAEVYDWLDQNGTGVYVLENLHPHRPNGEVSYSALVQKFAFSDRDSAFEFKMRWG